MEFIQIQLCEKSIKMSTSRKGYWVQKKAGKGARKSYYESNSLKVQKSANFTLFLSL